MVTFEGPGENIKWKQYRLPIKVAEVYGLQREISFERFSAMERLVYGAGDVAGGRTRKILY